MVNTQVVMGRDYPEATIANLSGLYTTWAGGLLAWPFIDLPWTPFGKAVRAKQQLLDWFQVRLQVVQETVGWLECLHGVWAGFGGPCCRSAEGLGLLLMLSCCLLCRHCSSYWCWPYFPALF
jgi:hypothetical protein